MSTAEVKQAKTQTLQIKLSDADRDLINKVSKHYGGMPLGPVIRLVMLEHARALGILGAPQQT